jgi:glycosyltransferase involved in cell wall biosynthesis
VTPARLLTFVWAAIQKRPHVVGGLGLNFNGIVAVIVGRLTGARSMYFCLGGPEAYNVGFASENNFFATMETADTVVQSRLLRMIAESDTVVTMGTRVVSFFRDKGIDTDFHVVSGGIDPIRFQPAKEAPSYDLILIGRLVKVKRMDVFLQAVANVVDKNPDVRAVIVGDGKLRDELHSLSVDLGIDSNVSFVGYRDDIENWLRRSKVFVLTSDSEGLPLSVMEAMMCGLPAVVSDVGDLADLVENGVNGYLVPRRSPERFAARIIELLTDARRLEAFSQAARYSALRYTTEAATAKWDNIIERYQTP